MIKDIHQDAQTRMQKSIESLRHNLAKVRTGRATSALVDHIKVQSYGSDVPLSQVATVAIPEPRLISIQVWDKSVVSAVEKAIRDSNLGLNPNTEGQVIRLRIPDLNEDRRKELVKVAHKYAEAAKVSIRHVRRDGIDLLKKSQKDGHVSEDETKRHEAEVQKATDTAIAEVDAMLAHKEKEILSV